MKKKITLLVTGLILLLTIRSEGAPKTTFTFDKDWQGWRSWGSGSSEYNKFLGHSKQGSIAISVQNGERTVYQKFKLTPGRYLITVWLRALKIGSGDSGYAGWFFYNSGNGIKTVVKDLKGSFNWSKGEFTVEVKDKPLELWWRLKAAGQLWLDDISIEPYSGKSIAWRFSKSQTPLPHGQTVASGRRCQECYRWGRQDIDYCEVCGGKLFDIKNNRKATVDTPPRKTLLSFAKRNATQEKGRHYLTKFRDKALFGKRSAVLELGKYNNINLQSAAMNNWSGYDYLSMNIFNPTTVKLRFVICIKDKFSNGYWNQLNHYTTLKAGWNKLRFRINRYVGERGSVRIPRYLDLKNLKQLWFAIEPESKRQGAIRQAEFLIDGLWLDKAPPTPETFKGLMLFDFVKDRLHGQRGFIPVTTRLLYNKEVGFGFSDAKIWRAQDDLYADNLHRDSIMINKGKFLVDLPNGKYIVRLVPFQLGLWNEHFWTRRKIMIEDKVVLDEKRSSVQDYLKEFLRFQDIEPTPQDNPYDLYLKKIFRPIIIETEVKDGQLAIDVDADNSGVGLNSLIIYPVAKKTAGEKFVHDLEQVQKDDFSNLCRELTPASEGDSSSISDATSIGDADRARGFYTALTQLAQPVSYNSIIKSTGSKILLRGGIGQRPSQALLFRNLLPDTAELKIVCPPLKSATGATIPVSLRYGVQQYMSYSFNHENFELAPRFLRQFPPQGKKAAGKTTMLLWLQAPLAAGMKPGKYTTTLTFEMRHKKVTYPVSLTLYPFTLPNAEIAVGYFGLDPVSFNYYQGNKKAILEYKQQQRFKVLKLLRDYGYTTWSSLPDGKIVSQGENLLFTAPASDQMMAYARQLGFKHKIFTYGGTKFLALDQTGDLQGMNNKLFRQQSAAVIKQHLQDKNWLPLVVDYSDEASGYSQKVARDLKRSAVMQKYYPYLRRGGFTHALEKGKYGDNLNRTFTDPSLSSYTKTFVEYSKNNHINWGLYNVAIGLFENGRACFGEALFTLSKNGGLDHLLEWYLTLNQNFPYYDLDGRENDAMMIFPRKDGSFDLALKFELNSQGLEDYRLLLLLEQRAKQAGARGSNARAWLKKNYYDIDIFPPGGYMNMAKASYSDQRIARVRDKIYSLLLALHP